MSDSMWDDLANGAAGAWEGAKQTGADAWDATKQAGGAAVDWAKQGSGEVAETAGTLASDFGGAWTAAKEAIPGASKSALGGLVGGAGDIAAGIGKLTKTDDKGNPDPNYGGAGDLVSGGVGIADWASGGKMGPWAQRIGGVAQAGANGYQAYEDFQKADAARAKGDTAGAEKETDAAWTATGDATIGAAKAATAGNPVANLVVNGGTALLDTAGAAAGQVAEGAKFSAGEAVGGLERNVVGDKSWGAAAADLVSKNVDGTAGQALAGLAGGAVNAAGYIPQMTDAAAGGLVNTIGNMIDGDKKKDDYYGDAKKWVGNEASSLANSAVQGAEDLFKGIF